MVSNEFSKADEQALTKLNIGLNDIHNLFSLLTEEEQDNLLNIDNLEERVKTLANLLNEKCHLPNKYKHLVENYNECTGVELIDDILI